eukprot:1454659-Prymnesium_polylepis.1
MTAAWRPSSSAGADSKHTTSALTNSCTTWPPTYVLRTAKPSGRKHCGSHSALTTDDEVKAMRRSPCC